MPNFDRTESKYRTVMLCATQRTGSNLMYLDIMGMLGHWGFDAELLYSRIVRDETQQTWPELWAEICETRSIGRIIILKVMFHYMTYIAQFIEGEAITAKKAALNFQPDSLDAFFGFFADSIWVRVIRRDPVAQAVSIYLAQKTGKWHDFGSQNVEPDAPPEAPAYDRQALLALLGGFVKERALWERFFSHYGITPITLDYDEAVNNYPGYLHEVLARLNVPPLDPPPERRSIKLGGVLNEEFIGRLREDAQDLYSPEELR